jgi:hypothetical protein
MSAQEGFETNSMISQGNNRQRDGNTKPSADLSMDDSMSVKSQTGFIIITGGTPVIWSYKLQTEIALSTCKAEYIALSAAMWTLLALRELLQSLAGSMNIERDEVTKFVMYGKITMLPWNWWMHNFQTWHWEWNTLQLNAIGSSLTSKKAILKFVQLIQKFKRQIYLQKGFAKKEYEKNVPWLWVGDSITLGWV